MFHKILVAMDSSAIGKSELLLGRVSNYVFHHAPCSVLVVYCQVSVSSEVPQENQGSLGASHFCRNTISLWGGGKGRG